MPTSPSANLPPGLATRSARRDFLRRAGLLSLTAVLPRPALRAQAPAARTSSDPTTELIFMSATRMAQLIRERQVSVVELVQAHIDRHLEVNDRLNAVVTNCYRRALEEARAADQAVARGELKGPLHGVPMTIKDSIDTAGVISTGATYGRQQYIPEKDATVVARLRKAGAILLGKTNTPEFTLGGLGGISTSSNLLFGSSHNPYDLTRSTAGSSGGAGAIVAAGGAAWDIGSDWGGSIRGPCHNNGLAGIKPTSVRVPRTGHIVDYGGIFDLWQQLGPMTRRVEDIELIMPLISGPDFRDAACAPVPWADPAAVDLRGLRVAFFATNGVAPTDQDTQNTVRQAVHWLEGEVASVEEDLPRSILEQLYAARRTLTSGDAWQFFQRLADRWGTRNIAPSVKNRMADLKPVSTAELVEAWEQADESKARMLAWMQQYDVLLCPVAGTPATEIDRDGTPPGVGPGGWSYTGPFNTTGWPVTVVRCGTSTDGRNLPIGVQVVGAPWREDITLAVARLLESKSGGWQRPPI